MSFRTGLRPIPQCSACIRTHIRSILEDVLLPPTSSLRQQVRGKKKMVNNSGTLVVRLLKDVVGFGRKGTFVPVPTGMMRNQWFPNRTADYISALECKQLGLTAGSVSRDFEFGVDRSKLELAEGEEEVEEEENAAAVAAAAAAKKPSVAEPEGISPARSRELLNIFVSSTIDFYRAMIPAPRKEREPRSASSAAADLLASRAANEQAEYEATAPIYGSVAAAEVAASIRDALSHNDEAKTISVDPEDITFTDLAEGAEADAGRIKNIGSYRVEIRVKGLDTPLARTIRVRPQVKPEVKPEVKPQQ